MRKIFIQTCTFFATYLQNKQDNYNQTRKMEINPLEGCGDAWKAQFLLDDVGGKQVENLSDIFYACFLHFFYLDRCLTVSIMESGRVRVTVCALSGPGALWSDFMMVTFDHFLRINWVIPLFVGRQIGSFSVCANLPILQKLRNTAEARI